MNKWKNPEKKKIAQERFLRFLVDGFRDISESQINSRLQQLELSLDGSWFVAAEISLHVDLYSAERIDETLLQIEEDVVAFLKRKGWYSYSYVDSRNTIILIIYEKDFEKLEALDDLLARLLRKLMSEFDIVIYAGIGSVVSRKSDICISAREADTCIMYKYSAAKENVVNFKNIKQGMNHTLIDQNTAFDRVLGCMLDGNMEKLEIRLTELLEGLLKGNNSLKMIKQAYLELMPQVFRCVTNIGIQIQEDEARESLQYIFSASEAEILRMWFLEKCRGYIYQMEHMKQKSSSNIIQMAKGYVERNYADPGLSQQSVSDYLGLSMSYFGQLFFSQMNQRFVDYLHNYRMVIAKQRLSTTNDKIKDISISVGYSNVYYFCTLFKKMFKMTPKEYRINSHKGAM